MRPARRLSRGRAPGGRLVRARRRWARTTLLAFYAHALLSFSPPAAEARVNPLRIFAGQIQKANMLVVLDTSGSMTGVPGGQFGFSTEVGVDCDNGLDCRAVSSSGRCQSSRRPCSTNADCQSGTCAQGGAPCRTDLDCSGGPAHCALDPTKKCTSDADCPSASGTCSLTGGSCGTCSNSSSKTCATSTDCGSTCSNSTKSCTTASDCGGGSCTGTGAACTTVADCASTCSNTGATCSTNSDCGTCSKTPSRTCKANTDCLGTCSNNAAKSCSTAADCPGTCSGTGAACTTNADCGGVCSSDSTKSCSTAVNCPSTCSNNAAKTCTTDANCSGTCSNNAAKSCSTAADCPGTCSGTGAACITNADCGAVCSPGGNTCTSNAQCITGTCSSTGAACTSSTQCSVGGYTGRCSSTGGLCNSSFQCGGTCSNTGAACTSSSQCGGTCASSGARCSGPNSCGGHCSDNGAPCSNFGGPCGGHCSYDWASCSSSSSCAGFCSGWANNSCTSNSQCENCAYYCIGGPRNGFGCWTSSDCSAAGTCSGGARSGLPCNSNGDCYGSPPGRCSGGGSGTCSQKCNPGSCNKYQSCNKGTCYADACLTGSCVSSGSCVPFTCNTSAGSCVSRTCNTATCSGGTCKAATCNLRTCNNTPTCTLDTCSFGTCNTSTCTAPTCDKGTCATCPAAKTCKYGGKICKTDADCPPAPSGTCTTGGATCSSATPCPNRCSANPSQTCATAADCGGICSNNAAWSCTTNAACQSCSNNSTTKCSIGSCGTCAGTGAACKSNADCGSGTCSASGKTCKTAADCGTIFTCNVGCGSGTVSGNQMCQSLGFAGATVANGYWWGQCAGPVRVQSAPYPDQGFCPGGWSGPEGLTCNNWCGGADCVGWAFCSPPGYWCPGPTVTGSYYPGCYFWGYNQVPNQKLGTGSTTFSVYDNPRGWWGLCTGWNPGWSVRIKCWGSGPKIPAPVSCDGERCNAPTCNFTPCVQGCGSGACAGTGAACTSSSQCGGTCANNPAKSCSAPADCGGTCANGAGACTSNGNCNLCSNGKGKCATAADCGAGTCSRGGASCTSSSQCPGYCSQTGATCSGSCPNFCSTSQVCSTRYVCTGSGCSRTCDWVTTCRPVTTCVGQSCIGQACNLPTCTTSTCNLPACNLRTCTLPTCVSNTCQPETCNGDTCNYPKNTCDPATNTCGGAKANGCVSSSTNTCITTSDTCIPKGPGGKLKMCHAAQVLCASNADCPTVGDFCGPATSRAVVVKRVLRQVVEDDHNLVNFGLMTFWQSGYFPYYSVTPGTPATAVAFLSRDVLEASGCYSDAAGPSFACTVSGSSFSLSGSPDSRYRITQPGDLFLDLDRDWSPSATPPCTAFCPISGQGTGRYMGSYYRYQTYRGAPSTTATVEASYSGKAIPIAGTPNLYYQARPDYYNGGPPPPLATTDCDLTGVCGPRCGGRWDPQLAPFLDTTGDPVKAAQIPLGIMASLDKASFGGVVTWWDRPSGCTLENAGAPNESASAYHYMAAVRNGNGAGIPPDPLDACRKNFILFVTDGASTSPGDIDPVTGASACDRPACSAANPEAAGCTCRAVLAAYHARRNLGVKTYVVGFGGDVQPGTLGATIADNIARAGGTDNGGDGLAPFAFSAPTEGKLARAIGGAISDALRASFTTSAPSVSSPTQQARGAAPITPYALDTRADFPSWRGNLVAYDVSGKQPVVAWDAAAQLGAGNWWERRVYTWSPQLGMVRISVDPLTKAVVNAAELSSMGLGATAAEADTVARWLLGDPAAGNPAVLGSIINSTPIDVGPPSDNPLPGGHAFYLAHQSRPNLIYVGSDDGMLHAFFTRAATLGAKTFPAGSEAFAFIPPDMLPVITDLFAQGGQKPDPRKHVFGLSDSPKVKDVCTSGCANPDAAVWKTVLLMPEGFGSKELFALDVTDPFTTSDLADPPARVAWSTRSAASGSYAQQLGLTVSVPGFLFLKTSTLDDYEVIFASGYADPGDIQQGRSVLASDTWTGAIRDRASATPASCATEYTLLSDVATARDYAKDEDDKLLAAYAGDTHGQFWRYNPARKGALGLVASLGCQHPLHFAPTVVQLDRNDPSNRAHQIFLVQVTNSALDDVTAGFEPSKLIFRKDQADGSGNVTSDATFGQNGQIELQVGVGNAICGVTDPVTRACTTPLPQSARPMGTPMGVLKGDGSGFLVFTLWYVPPPASGCGSGTTYLTVHEVDPPSTSDTAATAAVVMQRAGVGVAAEPVTGFVIVNGQVFILGSQGPVNISGLLGNLILSPAQTGSIKIGEKFQETQWTELP